NSGLDESACLVVKNIGKPDAGKPHVRFDEGGQGETCSLLYPSPIVGGVASLTLSPPGNGGDGWVDLRANLAAMPWLRFDWDGNGVHGNDPAARASFGIYKGRPAADLPAGGGPLSSPTQKRRDRHRSRRFCVSAWSFYFS
ncbi:MAG: DUF6701 domain-containing protein, partial [Trichloromonadaceae bacterium]